jgi:hypothetical protein
MEHNYRILIKFGEPSFEIESTDIDWLTKKEKEYFQKFEHQRPKKDRNVEVEGEGKYSVPMPKSFPPDLSINEFYRKYVHKINSRPIIGVFFIYYLQRIIKKDEINTTDVQQCFKDVAYPNWNKLNVIDILANAKRRALVNYVNKLWSLTTTGEDHVLNTISGNIK